MTGAGIEIELVDSFQVGYALTRLGAERMPAIKRVQHDSLQQIAERHVVIFGQAFQDLEQTFLKANPGLNSLNQYLFALRLRCRGCLRHAVSFRALSPCVITVHKYQFTTVSVNFSFTSPTVSTTNGLYQ